MRLDVGGGYPVKGSAPAGEVRYSVYSSLCAPRSERDDQYRPSVNSDSPTDVPDILAYRKGHPGCPHFSDPFRARNGGDKRDGDGLLTADKAWLDEGSEQTQSLYRPVLLRVLKTSTSTRTLQLRQDNFE
jgi:hypothetical protein